MSAQSDAAKKHIESLLTAWISGHAFGQVLYEGWKAEYEFDAENKSKKQARKWRFDYAVPALKVAIELDGGTFQAKRTGHASGTGLRAWREKNNAAMTQGWRVWHYAPEEVIKAGRKIVDGFFTTTPPPLYLSTIRNPAR